MMEESLPTMIDGKDLTPKDEGEFDFLLSLLDALVLDVERMLDLNLAYDREIINFRFRHEGIAFLSKTMPRFFKDTLRALEVGTSAFVGSFSIRCFGSTRAKYQSEIPSFLQGIQSRIFFSNDSVVEAAALKALYQICAIFGKYKAPFSNEVLASQIAEMIDDDGKLPERFTSPEEGRFLHYASKALHDVLGSLDLSEIRPKSGRGAVYPAAEPWEKYFIPYDSTLEEQYDSGEYFCGSPAMRSEGYLHDWESSMLSGPRISGLQLTDYGVSPDFPVNDFVAKMTAVPKTCVEARLINVENALRMRIQQGQRLALYEHVEHHPLTRGHVCFTNQRVNGAVALRSSQTRSYATLDLSKASDRNSLALVRAIWPSNIVRRLESSRTGHCFIPALELRPGVKIPSRTFVMKKFAPMGSAVCFPVEALTFWALGMAALYCKHDKWSLQQCAEKLFVYGDDIECPSNDAEEVIRVLELFGLKVNKTKSFWRGHFRESCGVDAYKGVSVSPIRIKAPMPRSKGDAESLLSWIALSDSLLEAGYTRAAWLMHDHVETILGPLPHSPDGRFIGWRNDIFVTKIRRRVRRERNHGVHVADETNRSSLLLGPGNCKPWYQGVEEKLWRPRAVLIKPDDYSFSEANSYLRWWEPKHELMPWEKDFLLSMSHALELCSSSSRGFTLRYTLVLEKVWTVLT
jgi:hypothetical protein